MPRKVKAPTVKSVRYVKPMPRSKPMKMPKSMRPRGMR